MTPPPADPTTGEALSEEEALLRRAEAACQPCGPCDAGLPMGCTCDPEPRAVIAGLLDLLARRARSAAEEAGRRGAVEERLGWSSWLDSWLSAVGPEPPTVEAVAEWLRADSKPWGRTAALASGRGTAGEEASDAVL